MRLIRADGPWDKIVRRLSVTDGGVLEGVQKLRIEESTFSIVLSIVEVFWRLPGCSSLEGEGIVQT